MDNNTVSVVLPFYNEEANVERVVASLAQACRRSEWQVQLVCVQNGSHDRTGELLQGLARTHTEVRVVEISQNRGYGYGIRQGLQNATGEIIGYLDGDGQIRPEDMLQVLGRMKAARAVKAVRSVRGDGWRRRLVSEVYNALFRVLFAVPTRDTNAKPKFFRKEILAKLALVSDDWFIDAEVMIKTAVLGVQWVELPVEFHNRDGGKSNVRLGSIIEFLRNLGRWRFGRTYKAWKKTMLPL